MTFRFDYCTDPFFCSQVFMKTDWATDSD